VSLTRTLGRAKFSGLRSEDLPVVEEALKEIQRTEGAIHPDRIVELAKDPAHPLHRFIYSESVAECARKYRLELARKLCRAVRVVFVDEDGDEQGNVPALVSVRTDKATGTTEIHTRRYVTIERAYSDPEIRRTMIADALTEAESWVERHQTLVELRPVFKAIEDARRITRRKAKAS